MISVELRGSIQLAKVESKAIDASNTRAFKTELTVLIVPGVELVLDLDSVEFIDSTGLGALVSALKQARTEQGDIKLSGLRAPVRALFQLVRMHRVFDVFNTADEAVASYGSKA